MAQVLVSDEYLSDIAQAIRVKANTNNTYTPAQMGNGVRSIPSGNPILVQKSIDSNGTYDASDDDADGYSSVNVNVPNSYSASDEGKVVDSGALVAQTSTNITQNGTYDTTTNDEVVVNVSGGGGGTLSGETAPTSAMGSNGDFYIQYQIGGSTELVPNLAADSNQVLASAEYSGYPKWKAFNGTNNNSYDTWAAAMGGIANHYIGYNFGVATTVDSLMVENRNEASSRAFKDFILQGSDDLSTWTDIESFTIPSSTMNYVSNFNLSNPATYKAFRLYITSYYDGSFVGAGIVQFYRSDSTQKVFKKLYNKQNGAWVQITENSTIVI